MCARGALEAQRANPRCTAAAHEIVLKHEFAFVRDDSGCDRIVAPRQNLRSNAEALRKMPRYRGERLPCPQTPRALDMECKVGITQTKPGLAADTLEGFHEVPGLIAPAPALFRMRETGKRIKRRIYIGRNV